MNFIQHASAHGLVIRDLVADNHWHRVPTTDHMKKRNGAYRFNGEIGFIQNWGTMQEVAVYRPEGTERVNRTQFRAITKKARESDEQRHQIARQEAAAIIRGCERGAHVYLASKGFPDAQGLIDTKGDLIIPMRDFKDYGVINGVQRIFEDGSKLFLPGTKAKGSVFVIGKGAWRERWLCEGYATGLSVQAALIDLRRQAEIIVCFSAGNLVHVATMVKRPAFVMADNDRSDTGRKAAIETGLPWVMPDVEGHDANDDYRVFGLRQVCKTIRGIDA